MECGMRLSLRFFSIMVLHTFFCYGKKKQFLLILCNLFTAVVCLRQAGGPTLSHVAVLELDPTPGGILLSELFLVSVTVLDHCINSVSMIFST